MFNVRGFTSTYCTFWILVRFCEMFKKSNPMTSTSRGMVLPSVKDSVTLKGIRQSFFALFFIALILIARAPYSLIVNSLGQIILGALIVKLRYDCIGFAVSPSIHTNSLHWIGSGSPDETGFVKFGTLTPIMNRNSPFFSTLNLNSSKYSYALCFLTPKTY
jgi:hypothetical protein